MKNIDKIVKKVILSLNEDYKRTQKNNLKQAPKKRNIVKPLIFKDLKQSETINEQYGSLFSKE
jgi:Mg2+/Co2+ transporter CorC